MLRSEGKRGSKAGHDNVFQQGVGVFQFAPPLKKNPTAWGVVPPVCCSCREPAGKAASVPDFCLFELFVSFHTNVHTRARYSTPLNSLTCRLRRQSTSKSFTPLDFRALTRQCKETLFLAFLVPIRPVWRTSSFSVTLWGPAGCKSKPHR